MDEQAAGGGRAAALSPVPPRHRGWPAAVRRRVPLAVAEPGVHRARVRAQPRSRRGAGRFAADRGATIAQLAVAWVLAYPAVQVAIVGSRTPAHLEESLGALDLTLSQGNLAEIDSIMAPRYRSAASLWKA